MVQGQTHEAAGELHARIAQLPSMDKKGLLRVWEGAFTTPPPPKLRKELMVPILAYRLQEAELGGLSHTARNRLQELIAQNRHKRGPALKPKVGPAPAKLIRSWHGEIHEVVVLDDAFSYRGEIFRSLSPIAKRITGTPWSGPAFFGTRPKDLKK